MRLKLYAYLLASTVFVPTEAMAEPISFAIVSLTASLQAAVGVGAAGFLIGAAKLVAGAALSSLVASAFADRPTAPPQEVQANFALEIPDRYMAYGANRIGGNLALAEQKGGQLSKLIAHCDSEATEDIRFYLNDIRVVLNGSNQVISTEYLVDGEFPVITLESRAGTITQPAMATLVARFDEWAEDHKGVGVADTLMTIAAMKRELRPQVYRHRGIIGVGEPDLTRAAFWGRVYDPRNDSTRAGGSGSQRVTNRATWGASTGNLALMIATHRIDPERFAMDPDDVNWENIAQQADYCDEFVVDRYGANVRRYHGGVVINKGQETNLASEQKMLAACDGIRFEDEEGRFGIHVGRYYEPTLTLHDEDIFEIASAESDDGETVFTHLYAKYTEPEFDFKATASAPWVNTDIWSEGQQITSKEVELYVAQHHNHAVRLLKAAGKRSSTKLRLQVLAGLRAKRARVERFIRLDLADAELSGVYELLSFERSSDRLTVPLGLLKIDGNPWELEEGEEGSRPNFSTAIEIDPTIPNIAVMDMDITTEPVVSTSGVARLRAEFPAPTRTDWTVEIQHRAQGEVAWENFQVTTEDGAGTSGVVEDGIQEIRWRVVGLSGKSSGYNSPVLEYLVTADGVAPMALTAFTTTGGLGRSNVGFAVANDTHVEMVDVYRVPFGTSFDPADETPIESIAVVPSGSYSFVDGDDTRTTLLLNGGFDADATWVKSGTGWTIGSGVATHAATGLGFLIQNIAGMSAGVAYRMRYTLSAVTAGTVTPRVSGTTTVAGNARTSNGTFLERIVAGTAPSGLSFRAETDFAGSMDNVSMFAETPDCAPQGVWSYYAVPRNVSNVPGPVSGPVTVTVV
jgi:hypothetical protein